MKERGKNRSDRKTRYKQLQDDLKEMREYWQLKEEALDRTLWRARLDRACGPVARQNTGKKATQPHAGLLASGLARYMLVCVCLVSSNLIGHAEPEKLGPLQKQLPFKSVC